MHGSVLRAMTVFRDRMLEPKPLKIADVGSRDVNGSYRGLFEKAPWTYVGLDIEPGSNVDIVLQGPDEWANIPDAEYDVVISGSTMEHTKRPWVFMKNIARIAKPGGLICVIAPYSWGYHEHPIDCWRVYPEGMRAVMESSGLYMVEVYMIADDNNKACGDTVGIARKW
jgi:SAM-dependent methyltransferase